MRVIPIITVSVAIAAASAGVAAGAAAQTSQSQGATRQFEGTIVAIDRADRAFRLRDTERGTVRITVTRSTSYERVAGFSALRVGMTRMEATVRRSGGRWVAVQVERSGGGGQHGGDDRGRGRGDDDSSGRGRGSDDSGSDDSRGRGSDDSGSDDSRSSVADRSGSDDPPGDDKGGLRVGSDDPPGDDKGGERSGSDDGPGDDHGGHGGGSDDDDDSGRGAARSRRRRRLIRSATGERGGACSPVRPASGQLSRRSRPPGAAPDGCARGGRARRPR